MVCRFAGESGPISDFSHWRVLFKYAECSFACDSSIVLSAFLFFSCLMRRLAIYFTFNHIYHQERSVYYGGSCIQFHGGGAAALLDLTEIHQDLAGRRVDLPRLEALKASAEKLSGLLSSRATAKGASKAATKEEREAVSRQRETWGACYRLLSSLGNRDWRVRSLLKDAAR
jgi:hypothetical protein